MTNQLEETFPRQSRLTRAIDFRQVFQSNFRLGEAGITILLGKLPGSTPRIGFAIAKKQIPKAIQRNRLKRILRESFRKNRYRLPARDLVIMVRKPILNIEPALLNAGLEKHWNSVIKLCEKS
ncbi:MAG: ribonuclease P protein component [Gammaproteobacteria bacterium]|nr:ribonuclease P protein component [Gammaproteobacteria bacterium]